MSEELPDSIELNQITPYIKAYDRAPIHRLAPKMGRNELCKISGKKFKNCCGQNPNVNYCKVLLENFFDKSKENGS